MQQAHEAVTKFHFIVSPHGFTIHCNNMNDRLQLQIDIFCGDIRNGVVAWLESIKTDPEKSSKVQSLLKIQFPDANGGIRI